MESISNFALFGFTVQYKFQFKVVLNNFGVILFRGVLSRCNLSLTVIKN